MGAVIYHSEVVPVRPGGDTAGGGPQVVAVFPELHLAFNVGSDPDFAKIERLFRSIGAVELTVTLMAGSRMLLKVENRYIALGAVHAFRVTQAETTEVRARVVVRGRHASADDQGAFPVMLMGEQVFRVRDGRLEADAERSPIFAVTAAGLVLRAEVQVDVLDYTHYWFDLMKDKDKTAEWFRHDRVEEQMQEWQGDTEARCLLHVRATPALWYAAIPPAARTSARSALSAFLFYLPYYERYGDLDPSQGDRWNSLWRLNRYVLAPRPGSPQGPKGQDDYFVPMPGKADHYRYTRIAMERSLRKSGRETTLLLSLVRDGGHGDAVTVRLSEMVDRSLRLLASLGLLAQGRSKSEPVTLGKLAVGGYSESGAHVALAVEASVQRVKAADGTTPAGAAWRSAVTEVYIFDTREVTYATEKWEAWLGIPGVRLRATRFAASPVDAIVQLARNHGLDADGRLTVWVTSPAQWKSEIDGNPWWRYVMQDTVPYGGTRPVYGTLWDYGHQFMILGGRGDRTRNETFLWEFLRDSDL